MQILAASSPGEVRIAVLQGDQLIRYALWRPGAPDGLGDIHAGRITARVPAMAGAFAEIGGGVTGFLPDSDGAAGQPEGTYLTVRVARSAQGGKGPRLAILAERPEPGPPSLMRRGPSALHRLAEQYKQWPIAVDDAALLAVLRPTFADRISLVRTAFDDTLESEVAALSSPQACLPGGMRASFSPTPALTAIDIDGGSATAARGPKAASQVQANRAALPALVRQIVLRNLSGAILIDFAGITAKRRQTLAPDLQAALAADPARARLLGFSHLGLAELLRPRSTPPLHEILAGAHAAGLAALRRLAADPARRHPHLRAAPCIVAALQADKQALRDLARRLTYPLIMRSDPSAAPLSWVIEDEA